MVRVLAGTSAGRAASRAQAIRTLGEFSLTEGSILTQLAGQLTQGWNLSIWGPLERLLTTGVHKAPLRLEELRRPRQAQHRLTKDQVAVLVADYESGLSIRATGKKHGVCEETVLRWLNMHGVAVRPQKVCLSTKHLAEARALRAEGWSYRRIGAHFGCSHESVRKILRREK